MKAYNKGSRFGKRDSDRGERRDFDRHEPGRSHSKVAGGLELFEVTCDKCGRKCDVPFKPTGNKPVYCRSCFRENESAEPRDDFEPRGKFRGRSKDKFRDDFDSKVTMSSKDVEIINRKLDKILKALKLE
jgi:CxxC-x17-CxxC domain-containing protein